MELGDLVKRICTFDEWKKHNSWMGDWDQSGHYKEIGIVVDFEKFSTLLVIHWPLAGVSWEEPEDVERLDGNHIGRA
jgi:hypothetical protein